jgi:hypothetical protein
VDTPTSSAGIRGSILASLFDPNLARAEATSSHTAVEGDITVTPANGPTQPLPPGTTYSSTVPFVPENIEAAILNLPPGFNVTSETQADGSTEYQIEAPDGETAEIRVAEQQNPDGSTTKQIDYLPAGQEPFRVERTESVETTPEGETIRRSTTRVSQGDKEQTISVTENEGTGEFTRTVEQEGEVVSSTSRQVDEQGNATIVTTDSQGNTVRAPASSFALDPETGAVEFEEPTGQFSEADPDEFTELVAELGDDDGTPGEDQAPAGEVPGDEAPEAGDDEVLDEAGPEVDPSTELEEATQVTEG